MGPMRRTPRFRYVELHAARQRAPEMGDLMKIERDGMQCRSHTRDGRMALLHPISTNHADASEAQLITTAANLA